MANSRPHPRAPANPTRRAPRGCATRRPLRNSWHVWRVQCSSSSMTDVLNAGTQLGEAEVVDPGQQLDFIFRPNRLIAGAVRRHRREIVCEEELVVNLARSLRAYIMKMRI